MSVDNDRLSDFLAFSTVVTGFDEFHLRGTGQAELYLATAQEIVGGQTVVELLDAFCDVSHGVGGDAVAMQRGLRRSVLSDDKLGPVARAIIKLWYVGTWYELPVEWRASYGEGRFDRTFVVSSSSYVEGLIWPAIGANPAGAKPPGYGTWAAAPRIDSMS